MFLRRLNTVLGWALFGCLLPAAQLTASTKYNPGMSLADLGRGLESQNGYLRGYCLSGEKEFVASPFFMTRLFFDKSAEDILKFSEHRGGGGINLGIIGADVSISGIEQMAKKSRTLSFVYFLQQRYGDWILMKRQASIIGRSLPQNNPARHRQICGDQVLLRARMGLEFYFGLTVSYDSEEQYRLAKEKYEVSSIFGSKSKTHISEFFGGGGATRVSVHIWQLGGQMSTLDKSFNGHLSLSCQRANIAVCEERFQRIQKYLVENIIPNLQRFRPRFNQASASQDGEEVLSFEVASYNEANVPEIAPSAILETPAEMDSKLKKLEGEIFALYEQLNSIDANLSETEKLEKEAHLQQLVAFYYECQSGKDCEGASP